MITAVEFKLVEDLRFERDESESPTEHSRRERQADQRAFHHTRDEQLTVPAGQVVTFHIDLPISGGRMEVTSEGGAEPPAWLSAASDMVNMVTDSAKEADWFRLEVTPLVEGCSAKNVTSERIRNLGRGELGGKAWSVDIN